LNANTFKKSFPSDAELLPDMEKFVMDIAIRANLAEDKYNNLALSVSEAAANSILHGNGNDKSKVVEITVTYDDKIISIRFKDQGKGFNLDSIPDPTAPENILKDHGRGIHIMKSFLSDLKFNFTPTGTEVTLELELN
jgi:serine/threonine-protein kinase RsbW